MSLLKEFLQWRQERKLRETLSTSWAAPYIDHPPTEVRNCTSEYKVTNPMMMNDEEAINAWLDHRGLYTVSQKPSE